MSGSRYGYARGLSTAEKLTDAQVEVLRRLDDVSAEFARGDRLNAWVGQSNRTRRYCVAAASCEALLREKLVERQRSSGLSFQWRITDAGRAILRGRAKLDAETDAADAREARSAR